MCESQERAATNLVEWLIDIHGRHCGKNRGRQGQVLRDHRKDRNGNEETGSRLERGARVK